jgi:hypothetical protein
MDNQPQPQLSDFVQIIFEIIKKEIRQSEVRHKEEIKLYLEKISDLMNENQELKSKHNQ